ncbi:MAG TPA: hypothetical protein PKM99_01150 [Thermotogota bacterium]|nr:hypothetical protein [Thermotogota bacterium]HPH11412.1 hypothetical protein [Thermotogota bacterium]
MSRLSLIGNKGILRSFRCLEGASIGPTIIGIVFRSDKPVFNPYFLQSILEV